jgi:hypothetical protein
MPPSRGDSLESVKEGGKRLVRVEGGTAGRREVRSASEGRERGCDDEETEEEGASVALALCHIMSAGESRLPTLDDADARPLAGERRFDAERLCESESRRSRAPAGRKMVPVLETFGEEAGIGRGEKRTAGTDLAKVPK